MWSGAPRPEDGFNNWKEVLAEAEEYGITGFTVEAVWEYKGNLNTIY